MVAYAYNPITPEAEGGGTRDEGQFVLQSKTVSKTI
jgi:hypothetical protein